MARKPVTLQRRHYELIASIIRELPTVTSQPEVAKAFALALRRSNPYFSSDRFLAATWRSTADVSATEIPSTYVDLRGKSK